MYRRFGKRLLDLIVAGFALVLLSPVLLMVAGAIWLTMGRPIFFRQQRPGLKGKGFLLVKFRTMTNKRDSQGRLASDAQRLTRIGRVLRKLSVDELPELWNVLRGEMSLVGPRPLLTEYLDRYTDKQTRRHDILPGITGWAQINGRQDLRLSERILLDLWYIDHLSFLLDLSILFQTLATVFFGRGVHSGRPPGQYDDLAPSRRADH